jgi:hypothetical protein
MRELHDEELTDDDGDDRNGMNTWESTQVRQHQRDERKVDFLPAASPRR